LQNELSVYKGGSFLNSTSIKLQGVVASLGVLIGFMYGEINGVFSALIFFMITDYITGIICAIIDKKISSKIGFIGICKKVLILIIVALGYLIDNYFLKDGDILKTSLVIFYLSNEGISILENISYIGLPIPNKIKKVLYQLKEDNEKE